tara:strand:+ start:753708 stop:756611 length:2904 start_codon:yes stop_codon:yes gene_type:complete
MVQAVLLPASARSTFDRRGIDHSSVLLSVSTDIDLDGNKTSNWLIVTSDCLSVYQSLDEGRLLRSVLLDDIQDVRTIAGVGSGRLQILLGDCWTDMLRYSNAHSQRFHQVSRQIEALAAGGDAEFETQHCEPARCDECGLRLPANSGPSSAHCPRCMQRGRILQRVFELIAPHRRGAIALCLLTVVGVVAELVPPKLQQYMVDHILMRGGASVPTAAEAMGDFRTALLVVVLALAASRVLLSAVAFIKGRIATAVGVGITGQLRDDLVTKLGTLSVAYYDRHNTGSIISRVSHDSEAMHGLIHQFTGGFLLQAVKLVGVGIMLMVINPKLALFTLIPVPFVLLGSWVFWNRVYPRYYRLRDASAKQMTALNDMLHGIRVVKAFGQEGREFDRFQDARKRLTQWRLWVDVTNSGYAASMQIVFSLGGLIVWYVGGRDVIGEEMTLGELIAFLAYLAMFYAPLNALSSFTTWLTSFMSGSKRVLELLDTPATLGESPNAIACPNPKGAIRFENVTFGYDANQPVLKDISFDVAPGEMVGIVGRSGSGKTTIVNLLSRFYDVQEGRITIDGIDVRELVGDDLRRNIGIVLQESFLFRGTIWKNLTYGRKQTSVKDALAAAKAAGAHDFICRQPLGYDTVLGQRGAGLSGGEKQRLSIARTLLYDPRILVLDEATSNIDAESEKRIQDALQRLTANRTTLAIAHRLSTLRNADRILVFDRGHLIEEGSHVELLQQDGTYAKMIRIQMRVSKNPNVDKLLSSDDASVVNETINNDGAHAVDVDRDAGDPWIESDDPEKTTRDDPTLIRWLDPNRIELTVDDWQRVSLVDEEGEHHRGVFCVRIFPARHRDKYISVRCWDSEGDAIEIGIIEDLNELRNGNRLIVQAALDRHYLLRRIRRVLKANLTHGYLDLDVETEAGPERFSMRWTASQAIDFGEQGKLLIDTEDNRYVVEDVHALPKPDRERFQQYVYW